MVDIGEEWGYNAFLAVKNAVKREEKWKFVLETILHTENFCGLPHRLW